MRTVNGFIRNEEQAQSTARIQIEFIMNNIQSLRRIPRSEKMAQACLNFHEIVFEYEDKLSPNQMSYLNNIYERTMESLGFPGASLHIDKKRSGLRYG